MSKAQLDLANVLCVCSDESVATAEEVDHFLDKLPVQVTLMRKLQAVKGKAY